MIEHVHIENFKCFKDFDIDLGPFNVLVGPNGSGKSAFFDAIRVASEVVSSGRCVASSGDLAPKFGVSEQDVSLWSSAPERVWRIGIRTASAVNIEIEWVLQHDDAGSTGHAEAKGNMEVEPSESEPAAGDDQCTKVNLAETPEMRQMRKAMTPVMLFQLEPRAIRQPSRLQEEPVKLGGHGEGLSVFMQSIFGLRRENFLQCEQEFLKRFPEYERIVYKTKKADPILGQPQDLRQVLRFQIKSGPEVPAEDVSDGALLSLAYLAVCNHPDPPKVLLIEEPENGIHPRGLEDVVVNLKHLAADRGVQVILTTHSPYLVDLVELSEMHLFAKDSAGAVKTRSLASSPQAQKLKDDFMTGEIWATFEEESIVFQSEQKNG